MRSNTPATVIDLGMSDELDAPPSLGVPVDPAPGPANAAGVSVLRALRTPFEAEHWLGRLCVTSLWLCIPVVGLIAVRGWASEGMARMLQNHPDPFPRLRLADFRTHVRRGMPAAAVEFFGIAAILFAIGASVFLINAGVWATIISGGSLALALLGAGVALGAALCGWVVLVANAILTRAEIMGRLGQALGTGQVWPQARGAWGQTLRAYALFLPLSLGLLALGASIGCIGVVPAWVAVQIAATQLRFQLYQAQLRGGAPALTAPSPRLLPSEKRLLSRGKLEARAK